MNEIFSFPKLFRAYLNCRKTKRKTINALKFEWNFEKGLFELLQELKQKTYKPGRSICFVVEKPTLREIFAASFKDRIVHHLLINELLQLGERIFIFDSYACRKNKGTHKAVTRLQSFMRQATKNCSQETYYLQLDIAGFFMSIDQNILFEILEKLIVKQKRLKLWKEDVLWLAKIIIFSKPTENYIFKGNMSLFDSLPNRKSLFYSPKDKGLPIGNYSSQFFANLYLNELDQFIKRKLKCRHYIRYVDDLLLLSNDKKEIKSWRAAIEKFLKEILNMEINRAKTKLQPLEKGVDFLGYFIKPKYTLVRRRVVKKLKEKMGRLSLATVNSYYGHFCFANSFNLRQHIYENCLGKLKNVFKPKTNYSCLKIALPLLEVDFKSY